VKPVARNDGRAEGDKSDTSGKSVALEKPQDSRGFAEPKATDGPKKDPEKSRALAASPATRGLSGRCSASARRTFAGRAV